METENNVVLKSHLTHRGRDFDATWEGGAYIDIRFAGDSQPTEVINVYDYAKGEVEIPFVQSELKKELKRWVDTQDQESEEWARDNGQSVDDWYGAYVENARYG